jgi:hypothetical protein
LARNQVCVMDEMLLICMQIARSPCTSATQQLTISWAVTRQSDGQPVEGLAGVERTKGTLLLPQFLFRPTVVYVVTLSVQVVGSSVLRVKEPPQSTRVCKLRLTYPYLRVYRDVLDNAMTCNGCFARENRAQYSDVDLVTGILRV